MIRARKDYVAAFGLLFITLSGLCEDVKSLRHNGFMNSYPRFREFNDGGNPGEPLYLTPLIRNKSIPRAQICEKAKVAGTQYHNVESYSGLLTVDDKYNSNMFFWFFPAEESPGYAPVVLWLQGGPGASSLFGLFAENGPFQFDGHNKLQKRNYTWSRTHNLIYIDNPVGTGFSYTDNDEGYANNEKDVGRNLHEAVQQIYELFEFSDLGGFWIAGESYAGKYIPALAHHIYKVKPVRVNIPLQGIAIGNGFSDPIHQLKYGSYLYQLGLIDDKGLHIFHEAEHNITQCISTHDLQCAFDGFEKLIGGDDSIFTNLTGFSYFYNYLHGKGNSYDHLGKFLQSSQTRRSIHVGNLTFHDSDGENKVANFLKLDFMDSVASWVEEILEAYHVCIYNGQLDIIVAYPLTRDYLKHLRFSDASYYKVVPRNIWRVDDDVAGYTKHAGNLLEVMVRNAGHMVPADQPKWMYNLIYQFTHFQTVV